MTAFKKSKAVGQVTEILIEQELYTEAEIKAALKLLPPKKKKRGK